MIKLEDIKQYDIFFECENGDCIEYIAYCDAYEEDGLWIVYAMDKEKRIVRFFYNKEYPQYAPRLYAQDQYTDRG